MPKIVDHEEVRESLRHAAWRVFAARGVKGTGLEHVAAAAGIGRSSLYHYYPDKDALLADLTEELLEAEAEVFRECTLANGTPTERLNILVDRLFDGFSAWLALDAAVFDLRGIQGARFRKFYRIVRRQLSDLIEEGQRSGEFDANLNAEHSAACIVGVVDGLLLQIMADPNGFSKKRGLPETTKAAVQRMVRR